MMDICFRNARVLDPGRQLDCRADVAVANGRILEVAGSIAGRAALEVDAAGCLLLPGLADIHAHVGGESVAPLSLPVDEAGLLRGATLLGDAGTAGSRNLERLLAVLDGARTPVAVFLNIHEDGIAVLPQDWRGGLRIEAVREALDRHAGRICGLKAMLSGAFAARVGLEGLKALKQLAAQRGLPLMLHLGAEPDEPLPDGWERFCAELPAILDAGDILSHCYTAKPGGLITPDRRFYPQLRDAVRRGVALDTAVALRHFDFARARQGLDDGFVPRTISTDLTRNNWQRCVFDLPETMSRFLALGMPLPEVAACVTVAPRVLLRRPAVGIRAGERAELTLLREHHGPCRFGEEGHSLSGAYRLSPEGVVWEGHYVPAAARTARPR